jgi:ATP-binding cassette subfamily C (CFTR/MRP) protein 1
MAMPMQYFLGTSPSVWSNSSCSPGSDTVLGPLSDCRFDFTLLFEQCVLSAVPSGFLFLLGFPRIYRLCRKDEKVINSPARVGKIVSYQYLPPSEPGSRDCQTLSIAFCLLQLALLVLWSIYPSLRTDASILVAILNIVVSIQIIALSHFEHTRSMDTSYSHQSSISPN